MKINFLSPIIKLNRTIYFNNGIALLALILLSNINNNSFAQGLLPSTDFQDAVRWQNELVPTNKPDIFHIVMEGTINQGMHVFSVNAPKKDANLPTTFEPTKPTQRRLTGKLMEEGKLVKEYDNVFETDVMYFKQKVKFIQPIKLNKNEKYSVGGTLKYQVCDEEGKCTMQTNVVEFNNPQP